MYDYSDYVSQKDSFWDMLVSNSVYQGIYQWIVLALLIAILIFVILIFVNIKKRANSNGSIMGRNFATDGVVFCKKCATQFDTSMKCCPKCGTMR